MNVYICENAQRPTAIVCASDELEAAHLYRVAAELPEQVAVEVNLNRRDSEECAGVKFWLVKSPGLAGR